MSVDGVAIATVTANIISALYLLNGLVKSESDVHVDFGQLRITKPTLIRILRIGIPAGIQCDMECPCRFALVQRYPARNF